MSTEKQADKDLSIPAQLKAMHDYATQRGWVVVSEFLEPGASGRTAARPALQSLLTHVRDLKTTIDIVLVHKIDRLARNVYDHVTIRAMLKQSGARLASVVENMDDSISGQLVENIMASIAQFYSANLADEVRKGMRQKVLRGGWPHIAPRGYRHVRDGHGTHVEPHPTEGQHIRFAFELYATGRHSYRAIAQKLKERGVMGATGRPFAPDHVRSMLRNPFYTGELIWAGVRGKGAHEPLVDGSLFAKVARVMAQQTPNRLPGLGRGFMLRGFAICSHCRGNMTASWQRSGSGGRFGYYRCSKRMYDKQSCPEPGGCPSAKAHADIKLLWQSLAIPPTTIAEIRAAAAGRIRERQQDRAARLPRLATEQNQIREQELSLTKSFVDGHIAPEAYQRAALDLQRRLVDCSREMDALRSDPEKQLAIVDDLLKGASSVWQLRDRIGEGKEEELVRIVVQSVVLAKHGVVGYVLRPPFDAIFAAANRQSDDGPSAIGVQVVDTLTESGASVLPGSQV